MEMPTINKNEAMKISYSCRSDFYPPMSIAELLKAGYTIYQDKGNCSELCSIVEWLHYVVCDC